MNKGELVARVKFWFGKEEPIFDTSKYHAEYDEERQFAKLYKKVD